MLALAAENQVRAEACVAKPGFITGQGGILRGILGTAMYWTGAVDTIDVKVVAAAMLDQVVRGFDGTEEMLTNQEMVKLGTEVLSSNAKK